MSSEKKFIFLVDEIVDGLLYEKCEKDFQLQNYKMLLKHLKEEMQKEESSLKKSIFMQRATQSMQDCECRIAERVAELRIEVRRDLEKNLIR